MHDSHPPFRIKTVYQQMLFVLRKKYQLNIFALVHAKHLLGILPSPYPVPSPRNLGRKKEVEMYFID